MKNRTLKISRRFPWLTGREKTGGSLPTVFNAANERAVSMFLNRKIGYLTIVDIIESAMERHQVISDPSVEQILETERETYDYIESRW